MLSAMDRNPTAIERAFELAKSGACTSVDDIKRCLRLEGFAISQIVGSSLARQLRALIAEARGEPMPKGPKGQKRPADVIGNAVKVMRIATGEDEDIVADDGKDKAAQSLGRRGGKARAEALTKKQRSEIAKKAAVARWKKED
jgi:hypothetical protein